MRPFQIFCQSRQGDDAVALFAKSREHCIRLRFGRARRCPKRGGKPLFAHGVNRRALRPQGRLRSGSAHLFEALHGRHHGVLPPLKPFHETGGTSGPARNFGQRYLFTDCGASAKIASTPSLAKARAALDQSRRSQAERRARRCDCPGDDAEVRVATGLQRGF